MFGANISVFNIGKAVGRGGGPLSLQYSGTTFSVADTSPLGISFDGTNFWVAGNTGNAILKYTASGVFVSSFDISAQVAGTPRGVISDGTYLWVLNSSDDTIYKYDTSGVYQNVSWVTSQGVEPKAIAFDGTHIWVTDSSTGYADHYKYTLEGVYTGVTWSSFAEFAFPRGLTMTGTHFWVADGNGYIAQYDSSGVYTGVSIYIAGTTSTNLSGITDKDGSLFVMSATSLAVFQYSYLPTPTP
tara:strand:+ start:872 stop:1600 length:729 start_codon:yes stop_codon:yes gene_type:complete